MLRQSSFLIAVLLMVNALSGRWTYVRSAHAIDYFTLWAVPHALQSSTFAGRPAPDIYAADTQRAMGAVLLAESRLSSASPLQQRATAITAQLYDNRVDATGTPFTYALAGLLATGDFGRDATLFQLVSLGSLIVAVVWLGVELRFSSEVIALLVAFFAVGFAPVLADARAANINQIQLLLLVAFVVLCARDHNLFAGVVLGLSIALKPNVVLVAGAAVAFALADRDFRRLARLAAGLTASLITAIVVGSLYFARPSLWIDFVRSVPRTLARGYALENGNYGLAELVASGAGVKVSVVMLLLLSVAFALLLVRRRAKTPAPKHSPAFARDRALLAVGVGVLVAVLSSGLAWLHYFSAVIPLSMYLLRPTDRSGPLPTGRVACVVSAALALALLSSAAQSLGDPLQQAMMFNAAATLLLLSCAYSIRSSNAV